MAVIVPCGSFSGQIEPASSSPGTRGTAVRWSPPDPGDGAASQRAARLSWSVQHATAYALLSTCVIIALFMLLAVSRYRRVARG
ncbi:hypothetical protein [Streptomyces parvulus]|uniref:hypothetical protein n=1 Tax=Streptomyces parvulus TaxID=146923 RepID=UPI003EB6C726